MKNLLIITIILGIAQMAAAGLTLCINEKSLDNTNTILHPAEYINIVGLEPDDTLEYGKATDLGGIFVQNNENPAITPGPRLFTEIELHHDGQVPIDILLVNNAYGLQDFLTINLIQAPVAMALLGPDRLIRCVADNLDNF